MNQDKSDPVSRESGSAVEVFTTFLKLGLTSFGGPIAHLSYFRNELVERRKWVTESQFVQLLAIASIFLPGFLLIAGVLPFWGKVSKGTYSTRAIAGVNAAVVGILGAALYDPIFVSAVSGPADVAIALVAFMFLAAMRLSALIVVAWCVFSNIALVFIG